ncbi:DUF4400 domain-containing protein [Vibrio sp. 10N.222.54.A1]|jgi:hypothetical protein|uniref:DUF4400 domain-containing protein n=1 Tax=unclassified Vibrio TaxID=2614977 RepID=UPI0035520141
MSDVDDSKSGTKPLWLAIILILSQVLIFISVISPEALEKTINQELEMMVGVYGLDSTQNIYNSSLDKSDEWLYESGAIKAIRGQFLPPEYLENGFVTDTKVFNTGFWTVVDRSINNLALNVEFTLLRIYSFGQWFYLFGVMIIASVMSGFLFREIKKHGFEYSSPLRHGVSRKLLYLMPLILYVMLVLPLAMHPFFYPLLISIMCMTIAFYISNTIKRV